MKSYLLANTRFPRGRRSRLLRLPRGAGWLGIISLVNVGTGFLRQAVIAYFFGAGAVADALLLALLVPRLTRRLVGNLSDAVILPRYVRDHASGEEARATSLLGSWARLVTPLGIAACAFCALFPAPLVAALAPEFEANAREQAAVYVRALAPLIALNVICTVPKVQLDARQRFSVPALAPVLVNVSAIIGAGLGVARWGAHALLFGAVVGGAGGVFWMGIAARHATEPTAASVPAKVANLPWRDLVIIGSQGFLAQLGLVVDRAFASGLESGSIAALGYANALNAAPTAVVGSALSTALLPVLAQHIGKGEPTQALRVTVTWSAITFALMLPLALILMYFRLELVTLAFQRGKFNAHAATLTADALLVLPGLLCLSGPSAISTRMLLALGATRALGLCGMLGLVLKVLFSWLWVGPYGLVGLGAATVAPAAFLVPLRLGLAAFYARRPRSD